MPFCCKIVHVAYHGDEVKITLTTGADWHPPKY